mmetsp:Transcript_11999/g.20346  ORF Transcript_11999/g.20346 Transcript_11999/m.20346 type:complete len:427 (+) Transcript_11999:662-1942(+)
MSQSNPQTSVLRFQFPDFEAHKGSVLAESSAADINGDIWNLMIKISESKYQRNGNSSSSSSGRHRMSMNFVLMREVTSSINTDDIKFSFVVRDTKGNIAHEEEFVPSSASPNDRHLVGSNLMTLFNMKGANASANGSVLLNGTLRIDIIVQALPKASVTHTLFNPFQRNMLNLFYSGERADISFEFGHFRQTSIRAHKFILETNAPALARLCECVDTSATVHLHDVSVEAFRFVLKYIYGGSPPNQQDVLKYGKEIIKAVNRYGVSSLKLEIERSFIELRVVDTSNCLDFICFAQENSCTALKEYAISYLIARPQDVMNVSDSAERLKDSPDLMLEILCAIMKIEPETISPPKNPKPKKWKGLLRRKRKNKKKCGKGKVTPVQPGSHKKVNTNQIAGMELLGTDTIRKEAIKVLQLCEEPRRTSSQ